jgi:hypothetical protein
VQIVSDLYSRPNALDGLASKGVHAKVTEAEADTCVVWTYMLAADIVRHRRRNVGTTSRYRLRLPTKAKQRMVRMPLDTDTLPTQRPIGGRPSARKTL